MKSICHRFLVKAPAEKIFEAITTRKGIAGWWTPKTKADPQLNSITRVEFDHGYYKELQVVELTPNTRLKWLVNKAAEEWPGTTITFELEPHKEGIVINFKHEGWKDYTPMYAGCSYDWALFLRSLRLLCENGTGRPFPDHH